jgi:hypothetical protein
VRKAFQSELVPQETRATNRQACFGAPPRQACCRARQGHSAEANSSGSGGSLFSRLSSVQHRVWVALGCSCSCDLSFAIESANLGLGLLRCQCRGAKLSQKRRASLRAIAAWRSLRRARRSRQGPVAFTGSRPRSRLDFSTAGTRSDVCRSKTNARLVVEGGERRAVQAERAVRHSRKFPNEPVAPLRAGRQCKSLWLLQWCRTF